MILDKLVNKVALCMAIVQVRGRLNLPRFVQMVPIHMHDLAFGSTLPMAWQFG